MADLIDRAALEPDAGWDEYDDAFTTYSRSQIEDAPTIDAEPVVRCGECMYMMPKGTCAHFADDLIMPSASDFCSRGKRRESE